MGIKKIVIAGLILAGSVCLSAQNKTILITESHLPYKSQTWFYSGNGQDLDESKIKSYWDQGKRITSVAYTTNGWFVTMANSSGITMQTYKLSQIWPKDWIKEKWGQIARYCIYWRRFFRDFEPEPRIHTLKFEKINGKYYIRFPAATYALKEITSTEFVFENDIKIGPDPYWSYYLAGTITEEMKEKRNNQFRIRVSKDWNRIVMDGDTMLIGEVTKEYYDAALAINQKAYKQAMQVNSMLQSQSYSSEVSDQLKADIEESERKLDQMNAKQNDLYKKRDDMNRGHTIIRYKSTNVPSTPSVWCSICNRYDKPHDHVLNDGRH